MTIEETPLNGAFIIGIDKHEDSRGFFGRSWCMNELISKGLDPKIAQVNTAKSHLKGTLRGGHFQRHPYQEIKSIRCTKGKIYNFIIDLRPVSNTFLKSFGTILSEDNHLTVYSPKGFAQGYLTLEDNSEITYFTSEAYAPGFDWGIRFNDPKINLNLPIEPTIISEQDLTWPDFELKFLKSK